MRALPRLLSSALDTDAAGRAPRSCNNVLYLRAAPQEEEEGGDAAMPEA